MESPYLLRQVIIPSAAAIRGSRIPQNWNEDHLYHAVGMRMVMRLGFLLLVVGSATLIRAAKTGPFLAWAIAINMTLLLLRWRMFSYDADMEWDFGSPWYRPTRVCHATSGSEFGWRSGTGKWPAYTKTRFLPLLILARVADWDRLW